MTTTTEYGCPHCGATEQQMEITLEAHKNYGSFADVDGPMFEAHDSRICDGGTEPDGYWCDVCNAPYAEPARIVDGQTVGGEVEAKPSSLSRAELVGILNCGSGADVVQELCAALKVEPDPADPEKVIA